MNINEFAKSQYIHNIHTKKKLTFYFWIQHQAINMLAFIWLLTLITTHVYGVYPDEKPPTRLPPLEDPRIKTLETFQERRKPLPEIAAESVPNPPLKQHPPVTPQREIAAESVPKPPLKPHPPVTQQRDDPSTSFKYTRPLVPNSDEKTETHASFSSHDPQTREVPIVLGDKPGVAYWYGRPSRMSLRLRERRADPARCEWLSKKEKPDLCEESHEREIREEQVTHGLLQETAFKHFPDERRITPNDFPMVVAETIKEISETPELRANFKNWDDKLAAQILENHLREKFTFRNV